MTRAGLEWRKVTGAEKGEQERVLSGGSQVLNQAGIFKEFGTIIDKTPVLELKPSKMP